LFDFKESSSGFQYSSLTDDDLKILSEAEQKMSKHHNSNQVLIAYQKAGETGQTQR
jgi:hypothetical protein